MNIIPWRRREDFSPAEMDADGLWKRLWPEGRVELASHLPELFRSHPFPAVNIVEKEENYCITMDCPGMDEDDFEVAVMGSDLVISGERKWEHDTEGKEFRRVESQYGKFERRVQLPENSRVEPQGVDASYRKGVLTVVVPKREKTPATKIPVRVG